MTREQFVLEDFRMTLKAIKLVREELKAELERHNRKLPRTNDTFNSPRVSNEGMAIYERLRNLYRLIGNQIDEILPVVESEELPTTNVVEIKRAI